MVWNSTWPVGSVSVKANRITGQQNTTYIETTLGKSVVGTNAVDTRDHFWDVGSDEDGRHRFIQSVGFTVGGLADDPVIGTGMDSVIYCKETNSAFEWFRRNATGIYQFIPNVLTGDVVINGSYGNVVAVPNNVYGEIYIYTTALGKRSAQLGQFRSLTNIVETWMITQTDDSTDTNVPLKGASGTDATTLDIRLRTSDAANGQTWHYIVTYRAL